MEIYTDIDTYLGQFGIGLCGQTDREPDVESIIVNTAHSCPETFMNLSTDGRRKL